MILKFEEFPDIDQTEQAQVLLDIWQDAQKKKKTILCPLCGDKIIILKFYADRVTDCENHEIDPTIMSLCDECLWHINHNPIVQQKLVQLLKLEGLS